MHIKIKKIASFLFIVLFSIIVLNTMNYKSTAETNKVETKNKIVSVVFDNSGSMTGEREKFARYSLQMLIGLLDKDDVLFVTPMNKTSGPDSFTVDLTVDRNKAISDALNMINEASGGTPIGSVDKAIQKLVSPGNDLPGLKSVDDYTVDDESEKYEYWLVILTDGTFDEIKNKYDINKAPKEISDELSKRIEKYGSLNTIYYSFGDPSITPNLDGQSVTENYAFSSYFAEDGDSIVTQMREVANKMSGRFSLDDKLISISNNKIIINLDEYDLSFKSISVIGQDFGGEIVSTKYNGYNIKPSEKILLENCNVKDLMSGCLEVYDNDGSFSKGNLEIEFNVPVEKEKINVLVEPSLYIEAYLEYYDGSEYVETDMQYINSHLTDKDKIRVQYRVFEEHSKKLINIEKIFGPAKTKVTYARKSYETNQDIPLVVGKNEISVTVIVNNGSYSLQTSMMCIIDKNPTDYRVESKVINNVDGDITKHKIEYTVYSGGKSLKSKEELADFTIQLEGKNPNGKDLNLKYVIKENGIIEVDIKTDQDIFGEHEINFKVISIDKLSRSKKDTFTTLPANIEIKVLNTSKLNISQFGLKSNTREINFVAINNNKEIDLSNEFLTYTVKIDGKDITEYIIQSGNKLTYIPTEENMPNKSIGDKTIEVTVSNPTLGEFTEKYVFAITEIAYTIEVVESKCKVINVDDPDSSGAYVSFKILRDGLSLPYEDVIQLFETGKIKINNHSIGWLACLPCGLISTIEKDSFGEPVIVCRVNRDWGELFSFFGESFIFPSEKDIEISYNGALGYDTFSLNLLSLTTRIIRWIILAVIIAFIVHTIIYLLGFKGKKYFQPGYFLSIDLGDPSDSESEVRYNTRPVNIENADVVRFHLKRFLIPFGGMSYYQKEMRISGVTLKFDESGNGSGKEIYVVVSSSYPHRKTEIITNRQNDREISKFYTYRQNVRNKRTASSGYTIKSSKFNQIIKPQGVSKKSNTNKYALRGNVKYPNVIVLGAEENNNFIKKTCITFIEKNNLR